MTPPAKTTSTLRIAVVGAGVAGSYLVSRLSGEHKVTCYERQKEKSFWPVCAWATSLHEMKSIAGNCGLSFQDYILHESRQMIVDIGKKLHIKSVGLCTFDKLSFEKDLHRGGDVRFGCDVRSPPNGGSFDLVVDATGFSRLLLPRPEKNYFIPSLEYKVRFREEPFDDFYIRPFAGLSGYFWYFPLGDRYAFVGAGDYRRNHEAQLNAFMSKHKGEVLMKIGRPIRITPPSMCQPFSVGNIVGVGEAIGTVYPLLGEGIIPSLQCAELLVQNIGDMQAYEEAVLRKFQIYTEALRFLSHRWRHGLGPMRSLPLLLKIFLHMKRNEKRYGLEMRLRDWLRVVGN